MQNGTVFPKKKKYFLEGGEVVTAASDEAQLLDMEADDFASWADALGGEELAQALEQERAAELENELEQDERPIDYNTELEDAEEEAAPTSEKRLKRELRAEALRRLEDAARTAADFAVVVKEWDRLDRNRERRERDHENLRGDVPLEYMAVPEPGIVPRWLNHPTVRQVSSGNFLDLIFDCPYEMHNLTANAFLSKLIQSLSEEHKEVLYFLSLRLYTTTQLAELRGQSDRNIRKVRNTIRKNLQRKLYDHLCEKSEEKPDVAGAAVHGRICRAAGDGRQGRCDPPGEQNKAETKKSRP